MTTCRKYNLIFGVKKSKMFVNYTIYQTVTHTFLDFFIHQIHYFQCVKSKVGQPLSEKGKFFIV